ncbi:hypothetical protein [Streptomyces sp. N35]|uniref:hypothetical protein n=1 Tax=Streptomyces sp. N35 TaxID=2795730 RepID=UPI0018F4915A|nr:hypothetical protein [Streptomyces sp. N35]
MSIFTRGNGARRAVDKVDELRKEVRDLKRTHKEKDAFIDHLQRVTRAQADQINNLADERNRLAKSLDDTRIEVGAQQKKNKSLLEELRPHRAAEANANAIEVPPMQRDTSDGADQATEPTGIDVRTLREADAAGLLSPVVRISGSGASADPATVRIPTVREPAA